MNSDIADADDIRRFAHGVGETGQGRCGCGWVLRRSGLAFADLCAPGADVYMRKHEISFDQAARAAY